MYIDDSDNCIKDYISGQTIESKFSLKKNKSPKGVLSKLYSAIHSYDDGEIVVLIDGDDWLAHERVLSLLNCAYSL
jgi:hypothetical protein